MKKLKQNNKKDLTIVHFRNDLGQHDYLEMREYFSTNHFNTSPFKVVVDCEGMKELPSMAFGVLCSLSRDAGRAGGHFSVIHVCDGIRDIMRRIHVDDQVKVFSTLTEATDAMK